MIEEDRQRIYLIALAGLLHDIGKFGQRTGKAGTHGSKKHPAVGDRFVNQHVPRQWRGAMAPVGWHHGDPEHSSRLDGLGLPVKIVALADRLSAGEREELERDPGRPKRLTSIFSRVNLDDKKEVRPTYFPLKPLHLTKQHIFATAEDLSEEQIKRDYQSLWDVFCADADAIAGAHAGEEANIETYLESMFHLLCKYTWSIPSAVYQSTPDVSLFEHLHTTAALSACFAQQWSGQDGESTVDHLLDSIRNQSPPSTPAVAGLLVGDLSGIQGFIYSLHNAKRATAVLRARSFYIQMLVEASARYLLRQLGLPITNALYIGGGGFSLIVPPLSEKQVKNLSQSINRVLAHAYDGEIYLALAHTPLVPSDFSFGEYGEVQQRAAEALEEKKNHRFTELSDDDIRKLFSPRGSGGQEGGTCSLCGRETQDLEPDPDDEDIRWCRSCRSFRKLGEDLRRARYLLLSEVAVEPIFSEDSTSWEYVLRALGMQVTVARGQPDIPPSAIRSVLFTLDDEESEGIDLHRNLAIGRKFLVNLIPQYVAGESLPEQFHKEVKTGSIKHFGVLAHQSVGAPYLGILRMDMDNLGKIFHHGLGKHSSLSRQATLSLLLSIFFEGWVGKIAKEIAADDKRERLYSVYSGGDDLFFVGSWDATVELAKRVRRDLIEYTGRPDLGISGGIVLVHEKSPLYIAANQAEGAESAAKHLRKRKDAISFLDISLPWERFGMAEALDTVSSWASKLQELINSEAIPRSLLHVIQDVHAQYEHGRQTRGEIGPWIWRTAYWLARAQERTRNEQAKKHLQDLENLLSQNNFVENIEWLALAARWAELATRKEDRHV